VRPTIVSLAFHGAFVAAVLWGNAVWGDSPTKTVYVSLVPAVPAVGTPQGAPPPARRQPSPPEPAPPPRPAPPKPQAAPAPEPQRPASPAKPADLPQREPPRELPSRDRVPSSIGLPDRSLPPRAAALPKPGEKELPMVASAAVPRAPAPEPVTRAPASREPEPPPIGQASGAAEGVGALSLNVSDFPYAWYIAQVHRKIKERWDGYALAGQQPALIFEIGREGDLRRVTIDKSSGNRYYDLAAIRAVTEARPFPPLPSDFKKPVLIVGLQFAFDPSAMR